MPILIAAANAALGAGLEGWLTTAEPDWAVRVVVPGRAGLAGALRPGLALVVATIAAGGESLVFAIRDVAPSVPVLALCERADPAYEAALLRAGATGAIAAGASRAELVRAVRELVAGRSVMSAAALRLVAQGPPAVPHLTGRQRDVLRLMAEGRSTREIAQRLVIAQSTVKTHIARLSLRLDLTGRGEMQRNAAAVLALAERRAPAPRGSRPFADRRGAGCSVGTGPGGRASTGWDPPAGSCSAASRPRSPRSCPASAGGALPPLDAAGVRAVAAPAPAPGAARAGDLAVTAAIARFEHHARMGSAEFAERYLRGEFGHAAWARVWFGLLQ